MIITLKRWRHSKLTIDREIFVAQKHLVNSMLIRAKANYYTSLIESSTNNPRQLWSTINTISGRSKLQMLPEHDNITILSNQFNQFFTDKVAQIRTDIGILPHRTPVLFFMVIPYLIFKKLIVQKLCE